MNKRAFSLLELVVVLLILGALTTMAIGQYLDSQKLSKRSIFESNINEIAKALSSYRSNKVLLGTNTVLYPTSLSDPQFKMLFEQEPRNPYTSKPMLTDNSVDSGIQYVSDGTSYKLCVVQRDVDDVNDNGVVEEVLPLSTKTACIGNTQTSVGVTFARNSVAYTSNGAQVGVNVPRFEQGKFGQGILIEEGTTNALLFRTGGTNIQNWYNYTSPSTATTYTITNVNTPYGPGVRITGSNVSRIGKRLNTNVINLNSSVASFSIYFKPNKKSGILKAWWDTETASGTRKYGTFGNQPVDLTNLTVGQWYRLEVSVNIAPEVFGNPTGYGSILVWVECPNSSADVEIVAPQLESKSYVTSWTDGTRQPEILKIPTNIVTPTVGTVSVWVNVNDASKRQNVYIYPTIFSADVAGSGKAIWLYHRSDAAKWRFQFANESGVREIIEVDDSITPNGWHHFAISWSANKMALYIDGIKRGEQPNPPLPASFIGVYIGCWGTGANQIDTVLDDFALYNRQLSDNEVQAIYNSGQSAPVDANTILKADFDGNLDAQSGIIQ